MAILDTSGSAVVEYTYDAWGKLYSTTGTLADTLGEVNPLTYRGYVYDHDTEFYYLQSRYYDPEVGRFINADALVATGQGLLDNNMFAYCQNNPVMLMDPTGEITIATLILIGSVIVGAASAGYTAYKEKEAGLGTIQIIGDSICAGFAAFSIVYTAGMSIYQCYQNYCYLNGLTPITDIGSSSSNVTLYRAVSPEEYYSTTQSQQFSSGPNSYEDSKYFATSFADAQKWGNAMYKDGNYLVLSTELASEVISNSSTYYYQSLDGIGPAYLIPIALLNKYAISIS